MDDCTVSAVGHMYIACTEHSHHNGHDDSGRVCLNEVSGHDTAGTGLADGVRVQFLSEGADFVVFV